MGKIIAAVSGKGGTGKTTTVANLGLSFAKLQKNTLVVDLDIGLRNLDLALGLQNEVVYDVLDVVSGACEVEDALVQSDKYPLLSFLAAAQFKEKNAVSDAEMQFFAEQVREKFDYIILDCPAGIGENVCAAIAVSDTVLIVANHDPFSLRDGDRIASVVCDEYDAELKLLVNRFKTELVRRGKMPNILQVVENMAVQLVGAVPDSDSVLLSGYNGQPIALNEKDSASKAYLEAAKRLNGEHIPLVDIPVKKRFLRKKKI
ncbi:MAG: septum site-determining protein MinD [Clostridia bacterium]|nr:septum site-determining protein MinD [Clostridia bacterium]